MYSTIKRGIDFCLSLLGIIMLFPLFVLIIVLIKVDSPGPILFKQKRVGIHKKYFNILKFRTMRIDTPKDTPTHMLEDPDKWITKVGKFLRKTSLDELPQFINVLKGDMSIVGPRPPVPAEVKKYERWQLRRLSMKPGITCIWQVTGRNIVSFDTWMEMDLEYIDNWSLKMDFIIFLKTIRAVIIANGR